MSGRRTTPEDDQADEEGEGGHADCRLESCRTALVPADHGTVTCSTGTLAL